MITSDIKLALRNINRNKITSIISILGLGIGLGCLFLLQALIIHETTFDKFIPGYKNVYKVYYDRNCLLPYPLGEEMKRDFPEVRNYFRIADFPNFVIRDTKNEMVQEHDLAFADTSIYRILGMKFIAGVPASSPTEISISQSMARKYFGKTVPLGKILQIMWINDLINLTITGVYKDLPANSTLYPQCITDMNLYADLYTMLVRNAWGEYGKDFKMTLNWDASSFYTYVVLNQNTDIGSLATKMQKYTEHIKDEKYKSLKYSLQPVKEIYLNSSNNKDYFTFFRAGNSSQLKYYWAISFVILLISAANYIFLTRASASGRLRELGTKKALGASQYSLSKQIIIESTIITVLSLIPASFLMDPGMKFINSTMNRTLNNEVFMNPLTWIALVSIVLFIGTVSGLFISYNISRTPALTLLSGKNSRRSGQGKWNYSFLVIHFALYLILTVCVLTVNKQVRYSQNSIKGMDLNNIIINGINTKPMKDGFTLLRDEIEKVPGVIKAAGASNIPPSTNNVPLTIALNTGEKNTFDGLMLGDGMTDVLGMEFVEGTGFGSLKSVTDLIFNESAAKKFNIKVGEKYMGAFNVVGIVRDFNAHSTMTAIEPMVIIQQNPLKYGILAVKTNGKNDKAVMKRLRELYNQIDPNEVFLPEYLSESVANLYLIDRNQAKLTGAFSILAAILAVMGLFGISLHSISRKTKEIGLRKVNGASVGGILVLINKDFIRWVFVSIAIALPLALFIVTKWQSKFAYKTEISWWIFVTGALSAILIAILTVSWQSWRAATRNPVEALRYE
jgi:putative ABC transport system permease protein